MDWGAGALSMAPGTFFFSASISLLLRLPVPHWRELKSAQHCTPLAHGMCYDVSQIILHATTVIARYISSCLRQFLRFVALYFSGDRHS